MILPPFEMALRAGARSVMNSYTDIDGVPAAADADAAHRRCCATTLGFTGTVVADYFSVAFLADAAPRGRRARRRRRAWRSRRASTSSCRRSNAFGEPLLAAVADGAGRREARRPGAATGCCAQKCELGLLDPDWAPAEPTDVDLDDAGVARARPRAGAALGRAARERRHPPAAARARRVAVVGPRADTPEAMLGCYSFPMHVLVHHPGVEHGVEIRTVREALADTFDVTYALGCPVLGGEDDDIEAAVAGAADAEVCVVVLGDQAGLFGNGTSGEGCDVADLRPARPPGGAARGAARDRHAGRGRAARRAPLRPEPAGRPAGRRWSAASSRRGGRAGDRRRAERPGQPVGPAAGELPRRRLDPALDVPRARAGPAQRGERRRPDAAVRLRPRAVVRRRHVGGGVRDVRRSSGTPTAPASSWCELANEADRRRVGGRAGLPPRPVGLGGAARCSSWSARPGSTSRPASARGRASRCTPT